MSINKRICRYSKTIRLNRCIIVKFFSCCSVEVIRIDCCVIIIVKVVSCYNIEVVRIDCCVIPIVKAVSCGNIEVICMDCCTILIVKVVSCCHIENYSAVMHPIVSKITSHIYYLDCCSIIQVPSLITLECSYCKRFPAVHIFKVIRNSIFKYFSFVAIYIVKVVSCCSNAPIVSATSISISPNKVTISFRLRLFYCIL